MKGRFDGIKLTFDQLFGLGYTLPLPREFFISDHHGTNTYIILFYIRFISVYRALEKCLLLFIILFEFNIY